MSVVLSGCRVLVTRPVGHAESWRLALEAAGATVISYPTIAVGPPPSWEPLDAAFAALGSYDWLVFTSAAAVRFACERLPPHVVPGALARPQVAAVGGETARALLALGFRVSRVPEVERQEGLMSSLADLGPGTRVLFPQAAAGREELTRSLRARGCVVDVVPASSTVPLSALPPVPRFDVATFASPSALEAFVAVHGISSLASAAVVVIGPTTAAAAARHGLSPRVADAPDVESLMVAIDAARAAPHPHQGVP